MQSAGDETAPLSADFGWMRTFHEEAQQSHGLQQLRVMLRDEARHAKAVGTEAASQREAIARETRLTPCSSRISLKDP